MNHSGNVLIADPFPARIEGLRAVLRLAEVCQDYDIWKTFAESSFPNTNQFIGSLITPENFNVLLDNIYRKKIIFVNSDLSKTNAYRDIINYLVNETGNSSIAVIDATFYENDIYKKVITDEHSFSIENFTFERDAFLEQRQLAIENIQQHIKENVKALMPEKTISIQSNNADIQLLDKLQVDIKLQIGADVPLELISIESMFAETFSDTYYMARDLHNAFHDLIASHLNEITTNHIPVFDTLVEETDTYFHLTFVDANNLNGPAVTIKNINTPIFKRVSRFIKNISINHINTVGSTSMNLYFGIKALCHLIEHGFNTGTGGISNKNLATAIEVHFYVNTIGLMQGLVEPAVAGAKYALAHGIKSAMLITAIKPYIRMSITLLKMSSGGRVLLSLGRFTSKALPIIGLFINFADLSLNVTELYLNEDPYQRPIIITNIVFSSLGLTVSLAAIGAMAVGASALLGPLALIGLGTAAFAIPVTYLVSEISNHIESARNIGLTIEHIVNEIKCGAYKKDDKNHLLVAPLLVPVQQLTLFSSALEVTLGQFDYFPTIDTKYNEFTHWYHIDDKYAKGNLAVIPIDDSIRTLILPQTPNYFFGIWTQILPFSGSREDAEFRMAQDLQNKDSGFTFQVKSYGGFTDSLAHKMSFQYENTEIKINIEESNWKLCFPWVDPSSESDDKKEQLERSNQEISERLEKITYQLTAKINGRQSIQLPGFNCNVNLHLNASNVDAIWFIDFFDNYISDKHLTITKDQIKIGKNKTIKIDGEKSKVYLAIPKYSVNNGKAYLDPREDMYIYNKKWTEDEQKNMILLFATKTFAYFYKHNEKSNSHIASSIWGVCNETKESIIECHDVKSCQKQGDGLIIITNQGFIFFMAEDFQSRKLISQIIGFSEDWFNQTNSPLAALKSANDHLNETPHSPIVHFYLTYCKNEFSASTADILFDVEKQKYFIVDPRYAFPSQPNFLLFDMASQCGFFYAKNQKELIAVKGLTVTETSNKIQSIDKKFQVSANDSSKKILNGLLNASITETGIKARLSAGLEVILKQSPQKTSTHMFLDIQKLILKDLSNQTDKRTSIALQEALSKCLNENLVDANKFKIIHPTFVAIEYNGKNIGFYEKIHKRTLCTTDFPQANYIIPLGTDANFAYHILNNNEIHQTKYITHLSEIQNGLNSKHKSTNQTNIFFKAAAITLFNRTIFLKHESLENVFENILKTISKLPEIDFIWIESKKYRLNLDIYENITISCMNLSKVDIDTNIEFEIHNLADYYLERQNFDLLLHCSSRKFTLIFKGVFESETIIAQLTCILVTIKDPAITGLNIPNTFKLSTLINRPDRVFYSAIGLVDILKNVPSSPENIESMFDTIFWPGDKKQQIYELLHWVNANANKEKSQYLLAYFKNYPNIMKKVLQRESQLDSILHLAIKDGKSSVIQAFFEQINGKTEIIKEFVLKVNQDDKTALGYSAESRDLQSVRIFLEEVNKYVGSETLKELVLKSDENGCNAIHYAVRNKNPEAINILIEAVNKHLSNAVLIELLMKSDRVGNTALHYAALYDDVETMKFLLVTIKNHLTVEVRKTIMLKSNNKDQTALGILVSKDHVKSTAILLSEINELFDRITTVLKFDEAKKNNSPNLIASYSNAEILKAFFDEKKKHHEEDALKKLIFEKNDVQQMAIHIFILNDQSECIRVLCTEVNDMFGTKTLQEMLKPTNSETDSDMNIEKAEDALEFSICKNKFNAFKMLVAQMKKHFGNDTLNKFVLSNSIFHYLIQCEHTEFFRKYLEEMQKSSDEKTLKELILKTDDLDQTLLDVLFYNNQIEHIWSVQTAITECLGKDMFNKLLLNVSNPLIKQSVLHSIVSHGDCEMLRKFWIKLKENVDSENLQKLIMMIDTFGQTAVHYLINFKNECESAHVFLKDSIELLANEKLTDLVVPTSRENMLQHFASHGDMRMITTFWVEIKRHAQKETLKKLILGKDGTSFHMLLSRDLSDIIQILIRDVYELFGENTLNDLVSLTTPDGENMLFYCANHSSTKTFKIFLMGIKKYISMEHLKHLLLHRDNSSQTILHILIVKRHSESIQILLNELNEFGEGALNDVMQTSNTQNVLELAASNECHEIFQIIWEGMKKFLTKPTAKQLILRSNYDGYTVLHILALKNKFENISMLLEGINEHFGEETLEEVMLKGSNSGENSLQIALSNDSFKTIETLFKIANEYLGKPILTKMITNQNMEDKNAFEHAHFYCSEKAFQTIIELARKYLETPVTNQLFLKGQIYGK